MLLAQLLSRRVGGPCPLARRLVWCFVVSSGVRFLVLPIASPLHLLCCLRTAHALAAARPAPCALRPPRRALRLRQLLLLHRALGQSQFPALAARTTATAFHKYLL